MKLFGEKSTYNGFSLLGDVLSFIILSSHD